jgi:hypothetical protein
MELGSLQDSRNTVDIWMQTCLLYYVFMYTIIMIIENPLVNILTLHVFISIYVLHIKLAAMISTYINCAFYWWNTLLFSCMFSLARRSPWWWLRRAETCTRKQHTINNKICKSDFQYILLDLYILIILLTLQI